MNSVDCGVVFSDSLQLAGQLLPLFLFGQVSEVQLITISPNGISDNAKAARRETDTLDKMQARVEYDLEYLRNWSLGLDLVIILRTVKSVLVDSKAY